MRVAYTELVKHRARALARGIVAAGDELVPCRPRRGFRADVGVASSWGQVLELQGHGLEHVLLCECGYLGNRNAWHSLAWDGLNGRGQHSEAPERPEVELGPWRGRRNGYCLVLGQVPTDWAVKLGLERHGGMWSYARWLADVENAFELLGFDVRYRPHPEVYMRETHGAAQRPLLEELEGAQLAVTLNSTAAVDAVVFGVPVVLGDERGSVASSVAVDLRLPRWWDEPPHRRSWANRLARMQWSSNELEDGSAWKRLKEAL